MGTCAENPEMRTLGLRLSVSCVLPNAQGAVAVALDCFTLHSIPASNTYALYGIIPEREVPVVGKEKARRID